MGGRVAEELVFSQRTNGAGNDIERATELARQMVCEWGMSDRLGPMTFGEKDQQVFLARDMSHRANYSEKTAQVIDDEIRTLVTRNFERAKTILETNRSALDRIAMGLLEFETLDGYQVQDLIDSKPMRPSPLLDEPNAVKKDADVKVPLSERLAQPALGA